MQKVIVIGGTGRLPEGLARRLRSHSLELVTEEQLQGLEDGLSLDMCDLVIRKVPGAEPSRMLRARKGKGEKRRNKKIRGW